MAATAYQKQYRQEAVMGFEDGSSTLRATTVTETVIKGNEAIFLVADSGSANAVTRGANGLIPARADNLTQNTATLAEWHDLVKKPRFNIFASQGNQNRIMQRTAMNVINRRIDDDIIAQLDTATNDTGDALKASLDMVVKSRTILGNNFVDLTDEDNILGLISPAFEGYMMQVKEFASAQYVEVKPFAGKARRFRRWMGVNWLVHSRLSGSIGAGSDSTTEKCYMYHRDAIGHAADVDGMNTAIGYDEEQDYSFCRMSVFMGSKLLQNGGIVQMKHDGSAYAAA